MTDASAGTARLMVEDPNSVSGGTPGRLSLDVTHKPLVSFVWWGVYVALAGGLLAIVARVKQVRTLDVIAGSAASAARTAAP